MTEYFTKETAPPRYHRGINTDRSPGRSNTPKPREQFMKKILSTILLTCLTLSSAHRAQAEQPNDAILRQFILVTEPMTDAEEEQEEATCLIKKLKRLRREPENKLEQQKATYDSEKLKNEIERAKSEYFRTKEELWRKVDELTDLVKKLKDLREQQTQRPDDPELKNETERINTEFQHKIRQYNSLENEKERAKSEYFRINKELGRKAVELTDLMKKLEDLREQQTQRPDDPELKNEIERINTEYRHQIRQYNSMRIPRSRLIFEGDMPPESMPWDRTDGGKVSVTFKGRDIETTLSDEEAEAIRHFLDDHVSEWIRGTQGTTEDRINQIVYVGSVTIRKENGYTRTYYIVSGEGLIWNGCYLPLERNYTDQRFNAIMRHYIKNVSKLPLNRDMQEAMKQRKEQTTK